MIFTNHLDLIKITNPSEPDVVDFFSAGSFDPKTADGRNTEANQPAADWIDYAAYVWSANRPPSENSDAFLCIGEVDILKLGLRYTLSMPARGLDHLDDTVRQSIRLLRQVMAADTK